MGDKKYEIQNKTRDEMNKFLNEQIKKYHKHSFIIDKTKKYKGNQNNNLTPMPKFYYDKKIF